MRLSLPSIQVSAYSQLFSSSSSYKFPPDISLARHKTMGFRHPSVTHAKKVLRRSFSNSSRGGSCNLVDVPKGFLAVYVGENERQRFVIPVSYLNQPSLQDLLSEAEQEFGFDHPMGGLTTPCRQDTFIDIISRF
ncbi:auxin-induced protein 15A-like [Pyrus ussuriensis x Pyrus communis]|uniref:Auxin-induced protein 15A-like n=1 Tax=Pyrus ussuriensis x Pyrus communis TaxID=2448454 RepID=A0A5N5I5R1_9ROSA|nr:auxin-induced protein 15A-like [Pyrus ussuriensis x Pyrus communis]